MFDFPKHRPHPGWPRALQRVPRSSGMARPGPAFRQALRSGKKWRNGNRARRIIGPTASAMILRTGSRENPYGSRCPLATYPQLLSRDLGTIGARETMRRICRHENPAVTNTAAHGRKVRCGDRVGGIVAEPSPHRAGRARIRASGSSHGRFAMPVWLSGLVALTRLRGSVSSRVSLPRFCHAVRRFPPAGPKGHGPPPSAVLSAHYDSRSRFP